MGYIHKGNSISPRVACPGAAPPPAQVSILQEVIMRFLPRFVTPLVVLALIWSLSLPGQHATLKAEDLGELLKAATEDGKSDDESGDKKDAKDEKPAAKEE